jgi:ribosomal 30S subunit maturation factor RimM
VTVALWIRYCQEFAIEWRSAKHGFYELYIRHVDYERTVEYLRESEVLKVSEELKELEKELEEFFRHD